MNTLKPCYIFTLSRDFESSFDIPSSAHIHIEPLFAALFAPHGKYTEKSGNEMTDGTVYISKYKIVNIYNTYRQIDKNYETDRTWTLKSHGYSQHSYKDPKQTFFYKFMSFFFSIDEKSHLGSHRSYLPKEDDLNDLLEIRTEFKGDKLENGSISVDQDLINKTLRLPTHQFEYYGPTLLSIAAVSIGLYMATVIFGQTFAPTLIGFFAPMLITSFLLVDHYYRGVWGYGLKIFSASQSPKHVAESFNKILQERSHIMRNEYKNIRVTYDNDKLIISKPSNPSKI